MRGQAKENIIAILCADLHLSLKAPVWRSAEPDWFEAMARPLNEIRDLVEEYECPVLIPGDIFDRWNSPPELVNFVINYIWFDQGTYTIPGQHDLPNHNLSDIERSAYWTLHKSKSIENLGVTTKHAVSNEVCIYSFPYGTPLTSISNPKKGRVNVALIHEYKWIPGHSYPNAPKEKEVKSTKLIDGKWMGYDVIVYGDNHKGFQTKIGKTTIFNCGTLMRRKSDEIDYRPQVGLLTDKGGVIPHYLDISKDKYLESISKKEESIIENMDELIAELEKLNSPTMECFESAITQYLIKNAVSKITERIIQKAIEESKDG